MWYLSRYFFYYWMQDCFTEGFWLFGRWEVAHDVQSAVAINGAANSIIIAAIGWSGALWRDRFGGRQMCIAAAVPLIFVPFSYAFAPTVIGAKNLYTVVFCWTVISSVLSALSSVSAQALQMDCLPAGRDGRPLDPARDFGLIGWANRISMLFLPIVIGQGIKYFPSHAAAYRFMYLTGGTISFASFLIYALLVHPLDEQLDLPLQCTRRLFHASYDKDRRALGVTAARAKRCAERETGQSICHDSILLLFTFLLN
jgi:hypothetical protein